jgi:YgiT-type zinc finger domain-containing protein
MTCPLCGGELQCGTAPLHLDRKNVHITVDAVPGWICGECGEPAFEATTVDAVQAILTKVDEEAERLQSPV